jgi:hypothetical protein
LGFVDMSGFDATEVGFDRLERCASRASVAWRLGEP